MRLLETWRKLLSGDEGGTGPDGAGGARLRAGILAGLTCGTVAVHALAPMAREHLTEREEQAPGQRANRVRHHAGNGP
ncbi:hypothetical protein ACIGJO_13170 [Streptomyces sp. NPDC079020]|uniref:hypothetical protein n=1 Tax=Streptomyces sp. NPDC079020 TaxID=3365722 RepID=UPI0037D22710